MDELKYFKAKIPFSSEHGIFNPADEKPSKAPGYFVQAWIDAGYAEEFKGEVEEIETQQQNEPVIIENEPQNEPILNDNEPDNVNVPVEPEKTENEEVQEPQDDFTTMSYPQLKKAGKAAGIKGYHMMGKDDLIAALQKG